MRKFFLISATTLMLPMAALAQTGTPGVAAATASSSLSAQDRNFARTAAAAGLSEVQEGQLAATKGDAKVKDIGNQMVIDHTKVNSQLTSLASSKGLTLPTQLTNDQAAELSHLQGLSGASFDTAYLKDQRLAHEKAIKLFETEASSGTDADLKSFAAATLPILKTHLKMIKAAQ
jgi:putative membrane protein